jgi:galactokinase/mevalonate kinase-like predicted kinase
MTPGVKLMTSKPGKEQRIASIPVKDACAAALRARSLLYFTGQKRMARNVLRRVLGFYAENPHGFGKILIDSVKKGARRAASALEKGDLASFAACVNDYWRDKKLLDAGSTNEKVDDIIDAIRPYASAVSLAGAGGGGFMYILAKSAADAKRIRRFMERNPPSPHSRFYDFAVDRLGMRIEKLV